MLLGVMTMTEHLTDGPCHAVFFRDNLLLKSLYYTTESVFKKLSETLCLWLYGWDTPSGLSN